MQEYDPVTLGVLWSRLISIVDEAAASLQRAAFSTVVRESNDLACALFDSEGNLLAQSTVSVPSFLGTLPLSLKHFLAAYPVNTLEDGDILATNDPWMGTGHLPDITMVRPIFKEGGVIGFSGSVTHLPDIGGRMQLTTGSREIFEEGLRIPICKLFRRGQANRDIFDIIANNVRVPEQVIGDIRAQVAANEWGGRTLLNLMGEQKMDNLSSLARGILERSEDVMRQAIAEIPDGEYTFHLETDAHDKIIEINAAIRVEETDIVVDYEGSLPKDDGSLNVPFNYTYAYTVYPIKCALDPSTPNNTGSLRPIKVVAPEGSLLNAVPPAAVSLRHFAGTLLPRAVFGCLAQVIPEKVIAPSGQPWIIIIKGRHQDQTPFASIIFNTGGLGARNGLDGISCLAFPTNVSNAPLEVLEANIRILVERKELIQDSGGAGQYRGGCGQRIALRSVASSPMLVGLAYEMVRYPPEGVDGGLPGKAGLVMADCDPISPGLFELAPGQRITIDLPGGGGLGAPARRNRTAVVEDTVNGVVSVTCANSEYAMPTEQIRPFSDGRLRHE